MVVSLESSLANGYKFGILGAIWSKKFSGIFNSAQGSKDFNQDSFNSKLFDDV